MKLNLGDYISGSCLAALGTIIIIVVIVVLFAQVAFGG